MTRYVNHYAQWDEERQKNRLSQSLPHKDLRAANWAAERVERGTGGAVRRTKIETQEEPNDTDGEDHY